jgi:methyl-accepting chemotaxis protein
MAVPILPIIKAVAPFVKQIATEAIPAFTSKPAEIAKSDPVIAKQIEELQLAATQNAESIQVLAEKLQQAIQGIEAAAQDAKKQIATYKAMLVVALGLSGLSMLLSIYLLAK